MRNNLAVIQSYSIDNETNGSCRMEILKDEKVNYRI